MGISAKHIDKTWTFRTPPKPEIIKSLSEELGISTFPCHLLAQRGITNYEKAKDFFRPNLEMLHEPFLMKDMDTAVERIEKAISTKEKILIYGDYDVDGTTAVSLLFTFLKKHFKDISYYIPNRYDEGYGVSIKGIDYAAQNKYSLIICLDCGIKANDKIQYAKDKGIDFVVCDHHLPGSSLPPAVAVLDPKRSDCSYPYKELSGCGIGFKLVHAFAIKNNIPFKDIEHLLDLVVTSIASDIVPITGENRVLAFYGLMQLKKAPRPGLKALLNALKNSQEITIEKLVFSVGPKINAAGRMETGLNAVKLLTAENIESTSSIYEYINTNNTDRRETDSQITTEALSMIESDGDYKNKNTTVLFNPNWHKGVIGIVASRLIEKHYRPTIVLTESNGKATGSARSVINFNVYNAIQNCEELIDQYGGHKYAAGLTMDIDKIPEFSKRFDEAVRKTIDPKMLIPEILIDAEIEFSDITNGFYNILKQFSPFGPENMKPIFMTKNLIDSGYSKIVGQDHLKLSIINKDSSSNMDAIAFGMGNYYDEIKNKEKFSICYTIDENVWNGKTSLQLMVKDIKLEN